MRFVLRAMCAAALVGCSDVSHTAEPHPSRTSDAAIDGHPAPQRPTVSFDSRTVTQRIEALFARRLVQVSIPSDDFSQASDAVHPDMACPPTNWMGARCWLLYTPYKNSNPLFENPAFLLASDDTTWNTPPQVRNPLIPYPGPSGYNSDPDHAFDPATRRMVQVYRVVADSFNKIMVMSTADARRWTTPHVAFIEKNHDAVSPSLIIEPDGKAKLWYVRAGTRGCDATTSSVQLRTAAPTDSGYERAEWSAPTAADINLPGYVVWHLDVLELGRGEGYVAMIAAYPRGWNCANSDIWLASSPDGVKWETYAVPVLWRTMAAAKERLISTWYRGTMRYDAATDTLDLWPSAMAKTSWNVYHLSVKLSDALVLLRQAQPADRANMASLAKIAAPLIMP
jgi:hypothetical protein